MLRDINHIENIDKNLRFILKTITYIEWPDTISPKKEDEFWERVKLSLPKLKSRELVESCSPDNFYSTVS